MEDRIRLDANHPTAKEREKVAAKILFFGIDVPQWPIVFYSALHLCLWYLIKHFSIEVKQIEDFFSNNFLVVLYVIVSFWLIETVLPFFLKKLVRLFSTLSFQSENKKISV